jgi:hypothetical protein
MHEEQIISSEGGGVGGVFFWTGKYTDT